MGSADDAREALGDTDLGTLLLAPMVAVAWADGRCDRREVQAIVDAYEETDETAALRLTSSGRQFLHETLLARKPEPEFLTSLIRLLALHLERQEEPVARQQREIIARLCLDVARASGGLRGLFRRVSGDEKNMLRLIVRELDLNRTPAEREMLRAIGL